jgi:hypothetical protein
MINGEMILSAGSEQIMRSRDNLNSDQLFCGILEMLFEDDICRLYLLTVMKRTVSIVLPHVRCRDLVPRLPYLKRKHFEGWTGLCFQ